MTRDVTIEPATIDATLRERFGLEAFRPWQREAIDALLSGPGRALVVAPTGGGKSLVYQLPACILEGTTLVISPLIALMEDQVRALEARGIEATFLASTLDPELRRVRENWAWRGRYKLLYIAPERLASDAFVHQLAKLRLPLVAIDEAHCISQWGHDFRPDYRRIGTLIERLRPERVLACTATATPDVRRDIREHLGFDADNSREVLRGFARPNLHLEARSIDGPREARVRLDRALASALGSKSRPNGGAIVYAATRRQTEHHASRLRAEGWNVAGYHAGMPAEVRTDVANRFAARQIDIVVATNAFGMGIDRADIRAVIHVQPPGSIEAYYQEVGRAGRDGGEAFGLLVCSGMDITLRRRLCELGSDGGPADPSTVARSWKLFRDLLRYLDACTCRHDFVLRYFGDERETLGGCGHCDVCAELEDGDEARDERTDGTIVRKALSAIARANRRAGMQAIAEMLLGLDNERTRRFGFTELSTYGLMRGVDRDGVVALLRGLLTAGWIDLTPTEHPVPFLTASGREVMRSTESVAFRLPDAFLAPKARRKPAATESPASSPAASSAVYDQLRAWRSEIARRRRVPPYVVALDRTLQDVARALPTSIEELPAIYGLGPARIEAYGESMLAVVRAATP